MTLTSEGTVEVVKVYSVEKHPNADKLDIVTIGDASGVWDYTIIDQRGSRKPGDYVVFVPIDSLLPLEDTRWAFLRPKDWDCSTGKSHHRVRGIKLRGIRTQGLITDGDIRWTLGSEVSEELNIWRYVSPSERELEVAEVKSEKKLSFFGKIRWWFGRHDRKILKTLLRGVPDYQVNSLKKVDPFNPGEVVVYTEKIHGTNVKFGLVGDKHSPWQFWRRNRMVVGSHRTWRAVGNTNNFYGEDLYKRVIEKFIDQKELPLNVIFYGEIFGLTFSGKPIQDLTYGFLGPNLRLFLSAWDVEKKCWIFNTWFSLFAQVPELSAESIWNDGSIADVSEMAEHDSIYGGIREGVVVHSLERPGVVGKYVSLRYGER